MRWQEVGFLWHFIGFSVLALVILFGLAATAFLLCFVLDRFGPNREQ
jgi:hypothetical protein